MAVTAKEQAVAEAVAIRKRRTELDQADRPWNTSEAMRAWVGLRIKGIEQERARG